MKKTNVSILSLISLFISVALTACSSGKENSAQPDKIIDSTFYPIAIGNYWVWQDSFFTEDAYQTAYEMTSGEAAIEIRKDSIITIIKSINGLKVIFKRMTWFKEGRVRPSRVDTAIVDKNGIFIMKDNFTFKLNMSIGDTVIRNGQIFLTKKSNCPIGNAIDAFPADTSSLKGYALRFVKGVGRVGRRSKINASNLIEYRIGNGPVIKKHWLMESPEK